MPTLLCLCWMHANLVPRAHVSFERSLGADHETRGLWERDWGRAHFHYASDYASVCAYVELKTRPKDLHYEQYFKICSFCLWKFNSSIISFESPKKKHLWHSGSWKRTIRRWLLFSFLPRSRVMGIHEVLLPKLFCWPNNLRCSDLYSYFNYWYTFW